MGGKSDALVRMAFWLILFLVTGSVWMRDGRHIVKEREAAIAKMKAAASTAAQAVKADHTAETTRPTNTEFAHNRIPSTTMTGEVDDEEEFDSFEDNAPGDGTAPSTGAASVGVGNKVHVQFCHG